MNKNIYYIKEFGSEEARDSFQAQIESIFERNDFTPILYPRVNYLSRLFFLNRFVSSVAEGSVVFFIHPLYSRTNRLLLKLLLRKKCKPVCVVSDINSLRFTTSLNKEIKYWKKLKYFIFQNERMKEWVEGRAGKKTSVNIGLFDLLFNVPKSERKNSNQVVFAGNTEKCPFIKELHRVKDVQWSVYGDVPKKKNGNEQQLLEGSYGLIWEGESVEDISNFGGQYLRWVSPLKLSNYLLHGMPVITHTDAATAAFIRQNNIGFCISSLHDIGYEIQSISETQYNTMAENCRRISKQVSEGYFTGRAIKKILDEINVS